MSNGQQIFPVKLETTHHGDFRQERKCRQWPPRSAKEREKNYYRVSPDKDGFFIRDLRNSQRVKPIQNGVSIYFHIWTGGQVGSTWEEEEMVLDTSGTCFNVLFCFFSSGLFIYLFSCHYNFKKFLLHYFDSIYHLTYSSLLITYFLYYCYTLKKENYIKEKPLFSLETKEIVSPSKK